MPGQRSPYTEVRDIYSVKGKTAVQKLKDYAKTTKNPSLFEPEIKRLEMEEQKNKTQKAHSQAKL